MVSVLCSFGLGKNFCSAGLREGIISAIQSPG